MKVISHRWKKIMCVWLANKNIQAKLASFSVSSLAFLCWSVSWGSWANESFFCFKLYFICLFFLLLCWLYKTGLSVTDLTCCPQLEVHCMTVPDCVRFYARSRLTIYHSEKDLVFAKTKLITMANSERTFSVCSARSPKACSNILLLRSHWLMCVWCHQQCHLWSLLWSMAVVMLFPVQNRWLGCHEAHTRGYWLGLNELQRKQNSSNSADKNKRGGSEWIPALWKGRWIGLMCCYHGSARPMQEPQGNFSTEYTGFYTQWSWILLKFSVFMSYYCIILISHGYWIHSIKIQNDLMFLCKFQSHAGLVSCSMLK